MPSTEQSFDAVIIGAGIGGLARAYHEKKSGASVLVLEKSARTGGVIQSAREEGFLLEYGPNTVLMKPEIHQLIQELGLEAELQMMSTRTPRYVLFQGKLHAVPLSPFSLLTTGLLTIGGKLRLLTEPFVPLKRQGPEESLSAFVRRRLGIQAEERLLAPFVSGVWAGQADELSAAGAFPKLKEWELTKGSLFKGAMTSPKIPGPKGLISFKNGLAALPKALSEKLKENIRLNVSSIEIEKKPNHWEIKTPDSLIKAKRVILTVPAWEAARFVPEASATLNSIPYAPVSVIHLGFHRDAIAHDMNGFGYLVAPSEKSNILGCLWSSALLSDRAPKDKTLLTVFSSGERSVDEAVSALKPVMGITEPPVFSRVTRYERAIPQYTLGHEARINLLKDVEKRNPGLLLAGNYRGGISVGDVIKNQFQNSF